MTGKRLELIADADVGGLERPLHLGRKVAARGVVAPHQLGIDGEEYGCHAAGR